MNKTLLAIIAASVFCIFLIGVAVYYSSTGSNTSPQPGTVRTSSEGLAGLLTTSGLWSANTEQLGNRLDQIGLPRLSAEGTALHIHQHLDIVIEGKQVPVPTNIGISQSPTFISDIHVHDDSSIIHVESPSVRDFYLGQFFDVWGVNFSATAIGGYTTTGDKQLAVYSNGAKVTGDPRQLKLTPHQEIVIVYGTPDQVPTTIPSQYQFPSGD